MRAATLLARAELRRHWRGLLVVGLLVAFAGGVTLAATAGARRTASSFDRLIESTRNEDVLVFAEDVSPAQVERLRALPGVEALGHVRQLALVRPDGEFLAVGGALDDVVFRDVARLRIVEGRAFARGAADEVVVPEPIARANGLAPGDVLTLRSFTQDQVDALVGGPASDAVPEPAGPRVVLRVVGVSRTPIDLSLQGTAGGVLLLPRPFVERHGDEIGNFSGPAGAVLMARLDDGSAGVPRFLGQLRREIGDDMVVDPVALSIGGVQDSIDVLTVGMLVFAAVAALAGVVALWLTIARQVALFAATQAPVRDLGMTRRMHAVALGGPVVVAAAIGTVVAGGIAWAASPLAPFGVAGTAEPDPGTHFDPLVLVGGAVVLLIGLLGLTALASWRAARHDQVRVPTRPTTSARLLEAVPSHPVVGIGVRMALEPGRGRSAVPVRTSLLGVVVAVLGVSAVSVFLASLDHLVTTPGAFGVAWDARVVDTEARFERDQQVCGRAATRLLADEAIAAIANACAVNITLNGRAVGAIGLTPLRGTIAPAALEGRLPSADDEVALGTETMRALGVGIGDVVRGRGNGRALRYEVVGRVAVPTVAAPQAVADGAVLTGRGLDPLDTPGDADGEATLLVRFRPGTDAARTAVRLERLPGIGDAPGVTPTAVPLEVERLEQVTPVPRGLAVFLAVLGAIAVAYLLATSVQRRRHEFAILKSIGFRRGQVVAAVATQATTLGVVGATAGLVLGVAAGTAVWRATAERVGLRPVAVVPWLALALVAVATLVVVNVVAAVPARRAANTSAAAALRAE